MNIRQMGKQVEFSTVFHPQIDGQSKKTIQTFEDMLRACIIGFGGHQEFLSLVVFAYSNCYQPSIQIVSYEVLYSRQCRSPIGWFDPGEVRMLSTNLVCAAFEVVKLIQDLLRTVHSMQKSYTNKKVCGVTFTKSEKVLLKVLANEGCGEIWGKGQVEPEVHWPV